MRNPGLVLAKLGWLYQQGPSRDLTVAQRYYEKAGDLNVPEVIYNLGTIKEEQKDFVEACRLYRDAYVLTGPCWTFPLIETIIAQAWPILTAKQKAHATEDTTPAARKNDLFMIYYCGVAKSDIKLLAKLASSNPKLFCDCVAGDLNHKYYFVKEHIQRLLPEVLCACVRVNSEDIVKLCFKYGMELAASNSPLCPKDFDTAVKLLFGLNPEHLNKQEARDLKRFLDQQVKRGDSTIQKLCAEYSKQLMKKCGEVQAYEASTSTTAIIRTITEMEMMKVTGGILSNHTIPSGSSSGVTSGQTAAIYSQVSSPQHGHNDIKQTPKQMPIPDNTESKLPKNFMGKRS